MNNFYLYTLATSEIITFQLLLMKLSFVSDFLVR